MKTIGDFKAAGLEISKNDMIDGVTRDKNSAPLMLVNLLNKDYDFNDAWTIREFSWRENTGEKPSFDGMIEWHSKVGTKHEGHIKNIAGTMVKQWRPLLNQEIPTETPEEKAELDRLFGEVSAKQGKSIYTQEMLDAGELPEDGMKFIHASAVATTISSSKKHGGVVTFTIDNGASIACCWFNESWVKPIDTRTPKEKADDLFKTYLKGEKVFTHKAFSQAVIDGDFGDNIIWVDK